MCLSVCVSLCMCVSVCVSVFVYCKLYYYWWCVSVSVLLCPYRTHNPLTRMGVYVYHRDWVSTYLFSWHTHSLALILLKIQFDIFYSAQRRITVSLRTSVENTPGGG